MERTIFTQHLSRAVDEAVSFARKLVANELPAKQVFRVYPSGSYDGNPLVGDEEVFPDDSRPDGTPLRFECQEAVAAFLWRDEKMPEWVDVSVEAEDGRRTFVALLCCGRFTATEEHLYHVQGGTPPFSVKSPILPPGYRSDDDPNTQRFDLNWQQKKER